MSSLEILHALGQQIDTDSLVLKRLDEYYNNEPPIAFLSAKAKEALGGQLDLLNVNLPRLSVTSLAERLRVTGFRVGDADTPDEDLWRIWRRNVLGEQSQCAMLDALTLGRSFLVVWAGQNRRTPLVTAESAHQMAVVRDPATRAVTAAVKRWTQDGHARAVVFEQDKVTKLRSESRVVDGAGIPYTGWTAFETLDNPLGTVPVVPLLNRGRLLEVNGVSEMTDLLPLCDGLTKLLTDMMTTSEAFARPRRWASGMELVEQLGPDGNPIPGVYANPFASDALRVWMAENPETKFGQFAQADVNIQPVH